MATTAASLAKAEPPAVRGIAWFVRIGLSTKTAIGTTLVVLLALIASGWFAIRLCRENLSEMLTAQQQTLAAQIADDLDQLVTTRKQALLDSSQMLDEHDLASPDDAQRYLDRNSGLHVLFDRSTFLFSANGKVIAEHPFVPHSRGMDFSWRDYFQESVAGKQVLVSSPFLSTKGDANVVLMLTAPIFARDGRFIGVTAGSLGLTTPEILRGIIDTVVGETGYIYLITRDGKLIMTPDHSRLMQRAFAPGKNPLFESALQGFEGSGMSIEANGKRSFTTFKAVPSTGWIVAVVYPEDEAFSSFNVLVHRLGSALLWAGLVVLSIVWLIVHGLVKKMNQLLVELQVKNEAIEAQSCQVHKQAADHFRFFQEASHDFRQRLHAAQLLVHAIQNSGQAEARVLLSKVLYVVFDLQNYVRDFLEFARLNMTEFKPVLSRVGLQSIFQKLELQFEEVALERKVDLKFRATGVFLMTDEKVLLRILENLVSNACKHARGKVLVAARESGASLCIEVWDNGPGIPEAEQASIFASYYQSSQCEVGLGDGVGLGLAIVLRLTRCLGYTVKVCSREGRLTAMKISIAKHLLA